MDVAGEGQVRGGFTTTLFRRPPDNLLGERDTSSNSLVAFHRHHDDGSTLGVQTTRWANPLRGHPGRSPPRVPPTVASITHLLHYSSEISPSFTRRHRSSETPPQLNQQKPSKRVLKVALLQFISRCYFLLNEDWDILNFQGQDWNWWRLGLNTSL